MSAAENPNAFFPSREAHPAFEYPVHHSGMTLRDYFAVHADQPGVSEIVTMAGGETADGYRVKFSPGGADYKFNEWWNGLPIADRLSLSAQVRYAMADAMLAVRDGKTGERIGMTTQADMLVEALRKIARGEVEAFDDDLQEDVIVPMDADEMAQIAIAAVATYEATRNAPGTVEAHIKDFRWRAHQCRTNPDAIDSTAAVVWDFAADALEQKA